MNMNKLSKADQFAEDILRTRGLGFPRIGMTIEVDGERGTIEGMNSSGNLDVAFLNTTKMGKKSKSCHPTWETVYFDAAGNIIANYRRDAGKAAA